MDRIFFVLPESYGMLQNTAALFMGVDEWLASMTNYLPM